MKSRILYTLLALYAITITAQTNVTSLVKNYSFENGLANWTNDGFQTQNNTAFTLKAGEWYAEKWVPEGGTVTNASLTQNIKITSAGTYTLTARAQNIQQASPSLVCKGVKLFIGDMSVDVNTAGTYSVTFTAVGSAVKLGLMVTSATGNWIAADHFMLSYTYDADKVNAQLQAEIDVARQLQNDANGSHSAKEALQQAIDAAASYINATSADGITDIVDKLQAAEYAYRLSAVTPEKPIDFTPNIVNADFTDGLTGWTSTGFQLQTNTAFSMKYGTTYAESWMPRGKDLGNISLSQQVEGLPHGRYILRVNAQHIDEDNLLQDQTGLTLYAEAAEADITKNGTYELQFTHIENKLPISIQGEQATGNWAAVDHFQLIFVGGYDDDAVSQEMARRISQAEDLVVQRMSQSALNTIQNYTTRAKQSTESNFENNAALLRIAIVAARKSVNAYALLAQNIDNAKTLLNSKAWSNGVEDMQYAIEDAEAIYNLENASTADLSSAVVHLQGSCLALTLANGTGVPPTVVTDPRYARGNNRIFARMSVSGSNVIEEGFCYSTSSMPTIADNRATRWLDSNGRIYVIENLTPGTIYYIRAYAITSTSNIGYGDVVKAVTLPSSNIHWSYENNGSPEENGRINAGMNGWYTYWSELTSINGYYPSVRIATGTPTADCGYGGWCQVGTNAGFQQQATLTHEMLHGIGVGTHNVWWGGGGMRAAGNRGVWLGERVTNVLTFWHNAYTVLDGDDTHMWPWGFNYASEDPHTEAGYTINALIAQALGEDGLPPTGTTATAYYALEQDNGRKYYLTNEEPNHGLGTAYLAVNSRGLLEWRTADASTAIHNDSLAWYIVFNPQNSLYTFCNAATGRYLVYDGSWHLSQAGATVSPASYHQLMRGRIDAVIRSSEGELIRRGYWIIHPEAHYDSPCLSAIENGKLRNEGFDLGNWALTQRWVVLTSSDLRKMIPPTESVGNTITSISVNDTPLVQFDPDVFDYIYEINPESQVVRYRLTYDRQIGYTGRVTTSRPDVIPDVGSVCVTQTDGSVVNYSVLFLKNYAFGWSASGQTGVTALPTLYGWGPRIGVEWNAANTADFNVYLDPYESAYMNYTDSLGKPYNQNRILLLQYPDVQTQYRYTLPLAGSGAYLLRVLYTWSDLVRTPELTITVRQKSTGSMLAQHTFNAVASNRQFNEAVMLFDTPETGTDVSDYEVIFSQNRSKTTVALSRLIITDATPTTIPTSIDTPVVQPSIGADDAIYDLAGRRVQADARDLKSGTYITGGRKIFVK